MDWSPWLEPGEVLRWQGRPAPRCWTFRNWRHTLFGTAILLLALWWQFSGIDLAQATGILLPLLLPIPIVAVGAYLAVGHLFLARWEWRQVCFAVTDRRVLTTRGLWRLRLEALPLASVSYYRVSPLGCNLATIHLYAAVSESWCVLRCLEHPELVTPYFDAVLATAPQVELSASGETA